MAEEFEYISRDSLPVLRDRVNAAGDIARVCVTSVDENGDPVAASGGGTQYTEGDTDATITGTAIMWEDAGDTLEPVSATSPLPVNVVAGGSGGAITDAAGETTDDTTAGTLAMLSTASGPGDDGVPRRALGNLFGEQVVHPSEQGNAAIGLAFPAEVAISPSVVWELATAGGTPAAGEWLRDNATPSLATVLSFSETDSNPGGATNRTAVLTQLAEGHAIVLRRYDDANETIIRGQFERYTVTGAATDQGTYWDVPVVLHSRSNTNLTVGHFHEVLFIFPFPKVDGDGNLQVNVVAGGTSGHQDDTAFAPGTTQGSIIMAHADEAAPDLVDEGDAGALRMTLARALHSSLRNAAGTEIGTAADPVRIDPTGTTTQPVSGTVTAAAQPGVDIGDITVNNAAGAAAVNIQDGGNSITVDGAVTVSGTVTADTELPAAAALADNMANPTTPLVGSCLMGWDGATWDRMPGTAAAGLVCNTELPAAAALSDTFANPTTPMIGSANKVWNGSSWTRAVSGAGAVGTGVQRITHASDDPVTTSVQIMDDWDESDRAKVNPIAGQAGVQGGSGAVTALTQRVVLATDVSLPTVAMETASTPYYTADADTLTTSFAEKWSGHTTLRGILICYTGDVEVELTFDGGTNASVAIAPGFYGFIDFAAMGLLSTTGTLDARSVGSAPTIGRILISGFKAD